MLATLLPGCGKGMPKAEEFKKDEKESKEIDEEALARRKAEREAKAKAEEDAKEHVRSEVLRLCVVPEGEDKAPTCEEVSQSYDAFVRRVGSPETIEAWDGGEKDEAMAMAVVRCTQSGSGQVASCQKHALDNAGSELAEHADKLLETCVDKFGKAGGDPGMIPSKPAG
jgi:hypothetical protein